MTNYRFGRMLGAGGMAVVHEGWRRDADGHEQRVAIKRIAPHLRDRPEVLDYFEREARLNVGLFNPHIVQVYELVRHESEMLLVMELIDGVCLERLAVARTLEPPVIRRILRATLEALAFLHSRSVAHRDITPANIMLSSTGAIKLADLGLGKRLGTPRSEYDFKGTAAYMSPEALQGIQTGTAADLYSVAAIAFHLLMGDPPFGTDPATVVNGMLSWQHPALPDQVPDDLRRIIEGGMTRLHDRAFLSANDMLAVLDHAALREASDSDIAALVSELVDHAEPQPEPAPWPPLDIPDTKRHPLIPAGQRRHTRALRWSGAAALLVGAGLCGLLAGLRSNPAGPAQGTRQPSSIQSAHDDKAPAPIAAEQSRPLDIIIESTTSPSTGERLRPSVINAVAAPHRARTDTHAETPPPAAPMRTYSTLDELLGSDEATD